MANIAEEGFPGTAIKTQAFIPNSAMNTKPLYVASK
jgi:hypothetical protein